MSRKTLSAEAISGPSAAVLGVTIVLSTIVVCMFLLYVWLEPKNLLFKYLFNMRLAVFFSFLPILIMQYTTYLSDHPLDYCGPAIQYEYASMCLGRMVTTSFYLTRYYKVAAFTTTEKRIGHFMGLIIFVMGVLYFVV